MMSVKIPPEILDPATLVLPCPLKHEETRGIEKVHSGGKNLRPIEVIIYIIKCVCKHRTCTHPNAIKNVVWLLRVLEK